MVTAKPSKGPKRKTIWIDLDNSPHVPFFAPIIKELEARGYTLRLTARDCFQVCELADLFGLTYRSIGRHHGKHKIVKALGLGYRALQLLPFAFTERPDLTLSHGSRSQLIASTVMGIPSVMMTDYEFARGLPGNYPNWLIVPEVIPDSSVWADKCKVLKYPGIKEDVYAPSFDPDPALRAQLGIDDEVLLVTLRPPATEAHYHNPESEVLLAGVIDALRQVSNLRIVLLPRNDKQGGALRKRWPDLFADRKIIIPERAVDGLNLIWHSDLVVSGGGTMNREAAALGVPVYSIFRGSIGAVDRYLEAKGGLVLLKDLNDIRTKLVLKKWERPAQTAIASNVTLSAIVGHIEEILESLEAQRGVVGFH